MASSRHVKAPDRCATPLEEPSCVSRATNHIGCFAPDQLMVASLVGVTSRLPRGPLAVAMRASPRRRPCSRADEGME
jgi:hypothetical protein